MQSESFLRYPSKSTEYRVKYFHRAISHWILNVLDIHHVDSSCAVPVHPKSDKVPFIPQWQMQRWIIVHALSPMLLHHVYMQSTDHSLTPIQAFFTYSLAFNLIVIRTLRVFRATGHKTGFLDGDIQNREGVSQDGAPKVVKSLATAALCRPLFTTFLSYSPDQAPFHSSLFWLPLKSGIYGIILDFWYYWYHRLMHKIGFLWSFHRTHHLVKRPNPLLSLYTDAIQELFDVSIIPVLTYFTLKELGFHLSFYDWWVCQMFVTFPELAGHSGLRVYAETPNTFAFILRWFHCELIIEDHDLHHRLGYRTSGNYGKQTRLWDAAFGTLKDRMECQHENVDWSNAIEIPLFSF
ncbi:hypothetical protein FVEN_g7685 [Fusarium venenatum]|nr:hypothetical protein FVEN_g7685 [Fusarium venenatum]